MNLNKVFLIGRLTRDLEMKMLPSGQAVVNSGLATDRYFTTKDGEKKQEVEFHNIVLFGRLAEIVSQYSRKGSLIFLEGRLRTRNWEDSSGNKRYRTEIIGERLQLGPKSTGKMVSSEPQTTPNKKTEEDIPIIEEDNNIKKNNKEEEEIDVKDIPF